MTIFVVRPEFDQRYPLVILLMDAPGYRPELNAMARRLASAGFAVAVPDLYHRTLLSPSATAPSAEGWPAPANLDPSSTDYREVVYRHMGAVTAATVEEDVAELLSAVGDDVGINSEAFGVFGYCMSGPFTLTLAAAWKHRIAAAASIHGVRLCHAGAASPHRLLEDIDAELYIACAESDDWAPPRLIEQLSRKLQASGCRYRIDWYPGTRHGFVFPGKGRHLCRTVGGASLGRAG